MATLKVYESKKEMIKGTFKEVASEFTDMLDCVDEPVSLDMEIKRNGVKVKITVEHCDGEAQNS